VNTVHESPELLILREHHAFNVCVSVTRKSTAQGRPFLVITTDRSEGNSLTVVRVVWKYQSSPAEGLTSNEDRSVDSICGARP